MKLPRILLVGSGGHALACAEIIECEGRFAIAGFLGLPEDIGKKCLGYLVIGGDEALMDLAGKGLHALVAIGQIKSPEPRIRSFERLSDLGYPMPVIISPSAIVSTHAILGAGSIIMHGAIVNAGARIGANCIINSRALIEHDAIIEDHCHISTGALVNGNARVGAGSFIGSGCTLREGIRIGRRCVVALGSVLHRDLLDNTTWNKMLK